MFTAEKTGRGSYRSINQALWSGSEAQAEAVRPYSTALSDALSKCPQAIGTVFRGTHLSAHQAARYTVGHIVTEPAFLSASTDRPFPGNALFTIVNSHTGRLVGPIASNPFENEVLFDSHTSFRVVANTYNRATSRYVIILSELTGDHNDGTSTG